jgi:hypothetical protein
MAKLSLTSIEGTIEADASDALVWLTKEGIKLSQGGPKALAALGVLLAAVKLELASVGSGNLAAAIEEIKPVFTDVEVFVGDLGIKL